MSAPLKPLPTWADVALIPIVNVLAAFVISGFVVLAIGEHPLEAVQILIGGALGDLEGIGFTLYYATSFIFTGLAVAVCFHAGLFNIGVEGQAYIAGLGAALAALHLGFLPGYSLAIAAIFAAALFGAAFAAIPGYLQAYRDSHIVITTIMFNYIASAIMGYLLVNVLRHPAFLDGATDTAFFDTHDLTKLSAPLADGATVRLSTIAAALADAAHNRARAPVLGSLPCGWRNLASGYQVKTYRDADGGEHRVEYRFTRTGLLLADDEPVRLVSATPDEVVLADDSGVACGFAIARYGENVYIDSARGPVHLVALPRFPEPGSAVEQGSLVAPMPGSVIRIGAAAGDTVDAGQALIWLEAMKMEHTITAPTDGVLVELNVKTGQQVEVGAVLGVIASAAQPGAVGHDHPNPRVEAPQAEGDS